MKTNAVLMIQFIPSGRWLSAGGSLNAADCVVPVGSLSESSGSTGERQHRRRLEVPDCCHIGLARRSRRLFAAVLPVERVNALHWSPMSSEGTVNRVSIILSFTAGLSAADIIY